MKKQDVDGLINIGDKVLVTCDNWFFAPDGRNRRAVYGTLMAILGSEETLGIKTNARSTNWYVVVGGMTIAGCQVHYVMKCEQCPPEVVDDFEIKDGVVIKHSRPSHIYNADQC